MGGGGGIRLWHDQNTPTYLPPSPPYLPTPGSIQTCLFHQKTVGICFCVLDMRDFLTGHLAGERVYPGDKGKYYLPLDHYLYGEGNGKLFNLHGVRKSGILVVEVILSQGLSLTLSRPQCMIFVQNLWRNKKACRWNLYIQLLLPFLCLNSNLSLELKSRIIGWSVNWQSDSTYLNNPAATELISSIKGDLPVIRYSLRYWTPGWFNY